MRYALLAVLAGAAVTLAACSGGSPVTSTATPPTPDESLIPQTGPAPLKPGASPQTGCPVDAAALEKALAANAELAAGIQLGKGLTAVSCAQGYATALTQPEGADRAVVLFTFDATLQRWVALNGGTSNVCDKAPADVRKQLQNC